MIIDVHTHIFKEELCRDRSDALVDKNFKYLLGDKKAKLVNHETMLKTMDETGVDFSIAVGFAWKNKKLCEEQNNYFSKVHELSEGKILPFGSVPLDEKDDIDGWVKDIKDKGLFGIGEIGFYNEGMRGDNKIYLEKVLDAAEKYSLPVNLHLNEPVGHSYTGKYDPLFTELYTIIEKHPDLTIIFAHWGGGLLFYELMPEISKVLENHYYDTAASPFLYKDSIYKIATDILGSEKILYGSDYPLLKFPRYKKAIDNISLNEEDKNNILGLNAAKIFKL